LFPEPLIIDFTFARKNAAKTASTKIPSYIAFSDDQVVMRIKEILDEMGEKSSVGSGR